MGDVYECGPTDVGHGQNVSSSSSSRVLKAAQQLEEDGTASIFQPTQAWLILFKLTFDLLFNENG